MDDSGSNGRVVAGFVNEASRLVRDLETGLATYRGSPSPDDINALFRAAHSLKSIAALFGVDVMADLAGSMEDVLDSLRLGRLRVDAELLKSLFSATATLREQVQERANGVAYELTTRKAAHQSRVFKEVTENAPPLLQKKLPDFAVDLTEYERHRIAENMAAGKGIFRVMARFAVVSLERELAITTARFRELGEIICTLPGPPEEDREFLSLVLLVALPGPAPLDVGVAISCLVAPESRPLPTTELIPPSLLGRTVYVDRTNLDFMLNTLGELWALHREAERFTDRALSHLPKIETWLYRQESRHLLHAFEQRLTELQRVLIDSRIVPLHELFDKLSLFGRLYGEETQKKVDISVRGGDVRLDRTMTEDLMDPLVHLVRNAMDHGIEDSEERIRQGKSPRGTVTIVGRQIGNRVFIDVEDDGAGLDLNAIRAAAVRLKLVLSPDAELTLEEGITLIFTPGFSTRESASELSGRGVGLDVVKTNLNRLSASVEVESTPLRGTRFSIGLPPAIAVVRALLVEVGSRTFVIPASAVRRITPIDEVPKASDGSLLDLDGTPLPLVHLHEVLGYAPPAVPPRCIVTLAIDARCYGLPVDTVPGSQAVIIRPLPNSLAGIPCLTGTADLASRGTALVLDPDSLYERAFGAVATTPKPEL